MTKALSIVVPIYNEEALLPDIFVAFTSCQKLLESRFALPPDAIEIIFVNDGSSDSSFMQLKVFCESNLGFLCLNLSKNHGHQLAITAGIAHSSGDAVVVIDGDLQDPPAVIQDLYKKYLEGFDVVYAIRKSRKGETLFKRFSAYLFYKLINKLSKTSLPPNTGDFRLMSRRVVMHFNSMKEQCRYIRGMIPWIGFKQTGIYYERDERTKGETHYPLSKMIRLALNGVISFSNAPLKAIASMGFLISFLGFAYAGLVLYEKLFLNNTVQ